MTELFTDGTVAATQDDIDTYLTDYVDRQLKSSAAELAAAEMLVEAAATRDEVQAMLDADADFAALGLTIAADDVDKMWVKLTFPTDVGVPRFWAGAAAELVKSYKSKATAHPQTIRVRADRVSKHLDVIRPLIRIEE
tara:strand:- start:975 stop:1388 length:414 start_codon:yes stop_codon:yes gene_type:complete